MSYTSSPCLTCARVQDPNHCENKNCGVWRKWFLKSWDDIRGYPRASVERAKRTPIGVPLGGKYYAHPHRVREYRNTHPCEDCYARALCSGPCGLLTEWTQQGGNHELEK